MRFGMCADLMNAGAVAAAGFDYIEGNMSAVAAADEEEFARMAACVKRAGICVEAMNVMMPGRLRLTGPAANLAPVKEYLQKSFRRAGRLGVKAVSFGSAGSRNLPEGWPREKGLEQLAEFLRMAAPIAAENGVGIGVEELNAGESNIVNTLTEAAALAKRVNLPNVGVLADWFHMAQCAEGAGGIAAAGPLIVHCHIANPAGRRFPLPGDGADYGAFFGELKKAGYGGRMSVEGNGAPEEYARTIERLRECV